MVVCVRVWEAREQEAKFGLRFGVGREDANFPRLAIILVHISSRLLWLIRLFAPPPLTASSRNVPKSAAIIDLNEQQLPRVQSQSRRRCQASQCVPSHCRRLRCRRRRMSE